MFDPLARTSNGLSITDTVRAALARDDALADTIQPILRHLIASDHGPLFGDAIIAQILGTSQDLSRQLLSRHAGRPVAGEPFVEERVGALGDVLLGDPALLAHLHGQALEWHVCAQLQDALALDLVISPLLQAFVASHDPSLNGAALKVLAAQTRWRQSSRRMQLPLQELPADLLQAALVATRAVTPIGSPCEPQIRQAYDEGATRIALLARLVTELGTEAVTALDLSRAGGSLFVSALAQQTGQDRDRVLRSIVAGQSLRLALSLIAAGMPVAMAQQQIVTLHPDAMLPDGLADLTSGEATALLAGAA